METDFRAFFLLVETIIKIRRNSVFKKYSCKGKLIMVGETDFGLVETIFLLHFSETPVSFFFRQIEKYFSTKSFIPAGGNRFSG